MSDVVVVRWPEDRHEVDRLASLRVPRLLLVAAGDDPPSAGDLLQDWVRLPGDERDVRARIEALRQRAAEEGAPPTIDRHGRLHYRGRWVQLSPIEERLARALVGAFEDVVDERTLLDRGWPAKTPNSNALRVHLHRLRRRVRPLGLEVRVVRLEGWVLQAALVIRGEDELG